jgi:uncharacterized membrane protein
MELFKKKFCAYQLCDHLEIGFEKRMNLNERDKLIVEYEDQFLPANYISWVSIFLIFVVLIYIVLGPRRRRHQNSPEIETRRSYIEEARGG